VLSVSFDEDITAVQAAEESDDGIEAGVGFLVIKTLETLLQLIIAVWGHVVRGQGACVHEILERYVSRLLELDVVLETFLDHDIDLSLESQ